MKCDNSAFSDDCGIEIVRILGVIQGKVLNGQGEGVCMDYNGNNVGDWALDNEGV